MEEELQSILLEDFEISWPGFVLRRVALNQHMPRVEKLSEHAHPFHQVLVYLRGHGTQWIEGDAIPVGRGTVLLIGSGRRHRFEKERRLRPVCLVLDFEAERAPDWSRVSRALPDRLAEIEKRLVALHEEEKRRGKGSVRSASLVLSIFASVEDIVRSGGERRPGPVAAAVDRVVSESGLGDISPGIVADRIGRSLDHLNRSLRLETGFTVGRYLGNVRREKAERLLRTTSMSIGEIGSSVGIDDQNYFSRWFRKTTGLTPTRWREAKRES